MRPHRLAAIASTLLVLGIGGVRAAWAVEERTVMIPMDDGTRLATDLYLPEGTGPTSTLLKRTPYNKDRGADRARRIAERYGVTVVLQDVRGRFGSEGEPCVFRCDAADGSRTIRWIAGRPWSNGTVVSAGSSAKGIVQYMHAAAEPEPLEAMWVAVATPKLYDHGVFWDGVFRESMMEGWLEATDASSFLESIAAHRTEDAFWEPVQATEGFASEPVPTIHWGGWYDIFSQGTIDAFRAYRSHAENGSASHQHLVMGPWTHGGWGDGPTEGELTYPDNAVDGGPTVAEMYPKWLAHWLGVRDYSRFIENLPAVQYYVMGDVDDPTAPGNVWRTAKRWPPRTGAVRRYLQPDGGLAERCPPPKTDPTTYRHDPSDPVPTRGGNNLSLEAGPVDQRPIERRDDVVVFETRKLSDPAEITGRVRAHLHVSVDAVDTDVMVRMSDVYPDGRSMLVVDGARRLAARGGDDRLAPVEPGEIVEVTVDLWSTSIILDEGHRLRISISSSNAPRFHPNPNDGSGYGAPAEPRPARVELHHSARYPSYLETPSPNRMPGSFLDCESRRPKDAGDGGRGSAERDTAPSQLGADSADPGADARPVVVGGGSSPRKQGACLCEASERNRPPLGAIVWLVCAAIGMRPMRSSDERG